MLESRGTAPRLYRNTLVFLAADKTRLQDLREAARRYLAWDSILTEKLLLNLDPQQVKQAETQQSAADGTVTARIPETYQWLLVPGQADPHAAIEWQAIRLSGQDALAVRASKKLLHDELLLTGLAGSVLRRELDKIPLWRGDHVALKQLGEDFARYLYLPRLKSPAVLSGAVQDGIALLTWEQDTFAYADRWDDSQTRYVGLRRGSRIDIPPDGAGVVVKSAVARRQEDADARPQPGTPTPGPESAGALPGAGTTRGIANGATTYTTGDGAIAVHPLSAPTTAKPTRFHATVTLDSLRVGRDAGKIADEVIAHLVGLATAGVQITLEIEARVPDGAPDHVVRTVTENCRTLKFESFGFEQE